MSRLCEGRKKCVALSMVGLDGDINIELPVGKLPSLDKFSYQVAWTLVKRSKSGLIVRISCGERSHIWLHLDSMDKKTFDNKIFEGFWLKFCSHIYK